MARPTEKTAAVAVHHLEEMHDLFGTATNIHAKLDLRGITSAQYREAMRGFNTHPEIVDQVETAWLRWKHQHLRGFTVQARGPLDGFRLLGARPEDEARWEEFLELEHKETTRRLERAMGLDVPGSLVP